MSSEHFFVTGALGCIGAWVVRLLVQAGLEVTAFDLGSDPHRLRLIMSAESLARVRFITGDIADTAALARAVAESGATHLIHLAALQVPLCKADPAQGARVNVVGTVNVFEAAKKAGLRRAVYASSVAVYGRSEEYPQGVAGHAAPLRPGNLYGVYKQANEGTARIYWQDDGISSIGLRPYTVYGPGRDQGMTSGPTQAMLAAVLGKPYHIPFGGRGAYQYAEDVARAFIRAAQVNFQGAEVFNLRGSVVHMRQVVEAIERVVPAARGQITFDDQPLPLPEDMDDAPLQAALGALPETSLVEGVGQTVAIFRQALAQGRLSPGAIP
jgi:nucleoside-diphosphate-sugar epimerase